MHWQRQEQLLRNPMELDRELEPVLVVQVQVLVLP
jgi:hypothetical protein